MKNFIQKFIIISLLMISYSNIYGQCSGCALTITAPNASTYDLSSYSGQTICIVGSGSFTGRLNNFNGNTLCIGTGVTYNPSTAPNYNGNWTIINNGTFQNVSNLNFNSGTNFTNAATGTIILGSVNLGGTFVNNGTLTATSINANTNTTLGGTTTISGTLSNSATLTITGTVVAGAITNNNTIIGGSGSNCNIIRSTGAFTNSGTIGNTGQYLYVGNTGGSILSPATSTSPTTPPSQPTSLALSNTGSAINGSFTQCTSNGYIILRAIAASTPATTNPTNFANLTVGQTIGSWTVAAINNGQSTTTFSDNVGATCTNVYYRIYAYNTSGNCKVYNVSNPLTGTYNFTPTITSTTPASRCGTGAITLGATTSAGTINWYNVSTGGTSLATGTTYATPSISTTTTYYVSSTNNGCISSPRTSIIATVNTTPTATAGTTVTTCSTTGSVNITAGANATNFSSITWTSNGTGTFTNPNSLTDCTYTPSAADISAGSITLTLTAYGNAPCGNATSTKTLVIKNLMTVSSGTAIVVCSTSGAINITSGSNAINQTSVVWSSSGTGTFANPTSLTTCTYTPSAADKTAGGVTLTLTALNGGCQNETSTKTLTINGAATAVAGTTVIGCSIGGAFNITAGASATNYSSITWTSSGSGTFTNPNSLSDCTYNPSAADITVGSVTLTLTAYGNSPCANATSTKTVTIKKPMTALAGTAIKTCSTSGAVGIALGASATNYTTVAWTSSGTGTFTSANSLTSCLYTPSVADISTGSVTLTLTVSNGGCTDVSSSKTLTINSSPSAVAGPTMYTCSTSGTVNIASGASATNYSSVSWTSNGTGTFTDANSLTTCTYIPSAADIATGSVLLTLSVSGNTPCGSTTSSKTLIINSVTSIIGTTIGSRTGAGTVTLGATASLGVVNWYDSLTGGTFLGTGTSFTTPIISTTTTYYVEAVNGACSSSPRTPVTATIKYPEIDIKGNATSIVSGDATPSTIDWTDFGTTITRTFTIYNTGNASLNIGTIDISGTNADDFMVTSLPNSTIPIGSSSTFTITYNPSVIGISTATISISNNDPDENPYTFDILATAIQQEIDIQGNAVSIVDGDSTPSTTDWTDFSNVAGTRTYTIRNLGNLPLNIGTITIGGVNASDFTVTVQPSTIVPAFGTTTFTVAFNPTAINTRTATISITNDDTDENPYDFSIQGFGIMPEIDIQGNVVSIPDSTIPAATTSNWTDFSTIAGTRTFTIYNTGNIALTIGAITFTGTNASEFSISSAPSSSVSAFSSTTFTVRFAPTAIGIRTAQIHIVNSDSNENPYDFNLQGTGVAQEIDIQGNGLSIVTGDMVTSISDGTDFGPADINLATITRTFTILNTGSMPLTISNPTISGTNASEFSISANPGTLSIGANSSTTFQVTFNPNAVFTRVAVINIVNNDSNENPYNFAIQGTGLMDNDGDGIENNADQDDDNDGIIDTIECGTCISDPFVNGSFENTTPLVGTATWALIPASNVTGWQTTPENVIEVWSTGMNGGYGAVPAAAGRQFAELNANVPGTLYQTFCLNGAGGSISWAIKHRGRAGTDVAYVKFGSTLAAAQASTPIATMSDGNTAWGSYSGTYAIPIGQTNIVLAFQAGATATGDLSVGNLIDDIQIIINQNCIDSDGDGVSDILDLDDENDGIPDIEEAGFKAYSGGKSTMDRSSATTWTDTNANGINDYIDAMITAGTYLIPDTDGDGVKNYLDLDSDNDSLFDVDESNLLNGDGDINGDGKGDGTDSDGDGILNLYDNSTSFGTTVRAYAQDTDANGTPDYLDLDSNDDGINDIQTGLYGSLDANGDGKIDGSVDIDGDGITDTFDTSTSVKGSPRDLNRKLYLDFDGRNDYAENTSILGGLSNATLMAWIDLNPGYSSSGVVVGQDKFLIKISNSKTLQAVVNGTTLTFGTALSTSRWYHVAATYGGGYLTLYLNGKVVGTPLAISGNIAADASKLTLGKNPIANNLYFKGKIDEVRVFNIALTASQLQRMVYQEIQNTGSQVSGTTVAREIGTLPFSNLLRYYRMDAYKDDIVDDLTTAGIDTVTGMKLYNHKVINTQQAPMPFTTIRTGTFANAVNDPTKDIRGLDVTELDYSIIQVKHNITDTTNAIDLAMFVDPGVTITMNNDTKIQNDWYLKLDGKIDLNGKSQLIQTVNSELDVTSAGSIERDQQGSKNIYNYNYWSSPVGSISTTSNNNSYTVNGVMKDGTTSTPQNINWTSGLNGSPTSPITLSNYWIYKFQNLSNAYANWQAVGSNGTLDAAQGFTLKGSGTAASTQNYSFVGKPNNGTITTTVAGGNLNLSGNPYASALDANAFISANTSSITGTLYFWEHASSNSTHNIQGYQGGYSARNLTGGTGPVAPAEIDGLGTSSKVPGRFIPVGQGFFVVATATGGTITFNNDQRLFIKENNVDSNTLFKNKVSILDSSSKNNSSDNNEEDSYTNDTFKRVRLGFKSADNYKRQILLGFMEQNATDGIDLGYDGINIDNQPNDMYFMNSSSKLTIQGVGYFNENNVYPIGIKTNTTGPVSITLDNTENMNTNQNVYILDNSNGEYHDITSNPFVVELPQGLTENRFSLTFKDLNNALSNEIFDTNNGIKVVYNNSKNILNINNSLVDITVEKITLFNIIGQSIQAFDVKNQNQLNIELPIKSLSSGTYIVKIKTDKSEITKKIIFN